LTAKVVRPSSSTPTKPATRRSLECKIKSISTDGVVRIRFAEEVTAVDRDLLFMPHEEAIEVSISSATIGEGTTTLKKAITS
jgi:hypothetical protein